MHTVVKREEPVTSQRNKVRQGPVKLELVGDVITQYINIQAQHGQTILDEDYADPWQIESDEQLLDSLQDNIHKKKNDASRLQGKNNELAEKLRIVQEKYLKHKEKYDLAR